MRKHGHKAELTQSKYFSIDSYFKSPRNKKVKIETEVPTVEAKKEQCPSCSVLIYVESESMEVHVNNCLDSQQLKDNSVGVTWKEKFACKVDINTIKEEHTENTITKEKENSVTEDKKCTATGGKENSETKEEVEPARRILPSSWKTLFSSSSSSTSTTGIIRLREIKSTNTKSKQKMCPFYKRVRDTRFVVDAFSYGKISDCDGYFLTHYHSDHFGGLRANWSHGPIYCSQVTANLVKQELHVDSRHIHALPMNELYPIPGSNVTICLIDANHCPGSVLFLFVVQLASGNKVRHLHTGDFRATPRMCLHPLIRQPENAAINCLYLDTTYLNPKYAFPAQEECIGAVCKTVKEELHIEPKKAAVPSVFDNWIKKKADPMTLGSRVLIVVGTYTIGKERVFFNIAKMLKCKIYAPEKKRKILLCQQDEELKSMLTSDPMKAQVHVVSLRDIRGDIMSKYLNDHQTQFDSLIGFKPTGWTYKSSNSEISDMKLAPLSHIIIPPSDRTLDLSPYYNYKNVKLYGVPYSEHSSFRELASFIASLDIKHIIPTVNISQLDSMKLYFSNWEQEKTSKRIEVVEYPSEDHW